MFKKKNIYLKKIPYLKDCLQTVTHTLPAYPHTHNHDEESGVRV